MLEDIKESILNFITSRIFVLVVIFLAFFGIMMLVFMKKAGENE